MECDDVTFAALIARHCRHTREQSPCLPNPNEFHKALLREIEENR